MWPKKLYRMNYLGLGDDNMVLVVDPTWEQIVDAIKALDRHDYPSNWLYFDTNADDSQVPDFEVLGGDGAYCMHGWKLGRRCMYVNPSGGNEEVHVWTSDQGTSLPAKYICPDIATVLEATRYYCEFGFLNPKFTWKECRP